MGHLHSSNQTIRFTLNSSRNKYQKTLGLSQEKQPPNPRQQAIFPSRQKDGQGFRFWQNPCFQYVQAYWSPFDPTVIHSYSYLPFPNVLCQEWNIVICIKFLLMSHFLAFSKVTSLGQPLL